MQALLALPEIDVDARDRSGRTALMVAAAAFAEGGVGALIEAGACATLVDHEGHSAADLATRRFEKA